jgi:hypothetical protein
MDNYLDIEEKEKILTAIETYIEAFSKMDVDKMSIWLRFPVLMQSNGSILSAKEQINEFFQFSKLRSKGYKRTLIDAVTVCLYYPGYAMVFLDFTRIDKDGKKMLQSAVLYTMINEKGTWKITSIGPALRKEERQVIKFT